MLQGVFKLIICQMKRCISFLFLSICYSVAYPLYLTNYPIPITQPDGSVVPCYATGDEYHRRIHDAEGYTLLRDPQTGYLVYALLKNDELVPSNYFAGKIRPETAGIQPNLDISVEKRMHIRQRFLDQLPEIPKKIRTSADSYFNTGTLNNLVVFIRFAGEPEFSTSKSLYEELFNKDEPGASMYSYFKYLSRGMLKLHSTFYPATNDNRILSYQDIYPRSTYENAMNDYERMQLEQSLLKRAIEAIQDQVPADLDLDFDNNGTVDNVCFVIDGDAGAWSALLWPHRSFLYYETTYIHGMRVWDYNFILENHLLTAPNGRQSVLAHETYHTLGAPDFYRYYNTTVDPAGQWEVMASNTVPPQSSTAYVTHKYGGWINALPEITEPGIYTLHNVWSSGNTCYKIPSPYSSTEFFMVEYRDKNVIWDSKLPGSGLIFYRIDTQMEDRGNSDGPPDELYVFRPGNNLGNAFFSEQSGRTSFGDFVLSNGSPGLNGLVVDQISASGGETMSFRISYSTLSIPVAKEATEIEVGGFTANWFPAIQTDGYLLSVYYKKNGVKMYDLGGFQEQPVGEVTSFRVSDLGKSSILSNRWYYSVRARSGEERSEMSNEISVTLAQAATKPIAKPASDERKLSFTANWNVSSHAVDYLLSVYYKEEGIPKYDAGGFEDRAVGKITAYPAMALNRSVSTEWYYRVKAVSAGGGVSEPSNEIGVQLSDQYDPVACDYASNLLANEEIITYAMGERGYLTGHNVWRVNEYAEHYRFGNSVKLSSIKIHVAMVQNRSHNPDYAKITLKVWDATDQGYPGNVLYSEDIAFDAITEGENVFELADTLLIPSRCFIGYQIYYAPGNPDAFVVYHSDFFTHPTNTAYVNYMDTWYSMEEGFGPSLALCVSPLVCNFIPKPDFSAETATGATDIPIRFINRSVASEETVWVWDFGDGTTSTEQEPQHSYAALGTYSVKLTAENNVGLREISKENYITINALDMGLIRSGTCKIYPNPVKDLLYVETEQPVQIRLYSLTGVLLLKQEVEGLAQIPVGRFSPGVYRLTTTDQVGGNRTSVSIVIF